MHPHLSAVCGHGHTQSVIAAGLGGPDQRQDLPERKTGHFPQHQDTGDPWNAACYRASLVEDHGLDLAEREPHRGSFLNKLMQPAKASSRFLRRKQNQSL